MPDDGDETAEALQAQVDALGDEIAHLRARMADAPKRVRALEERLLETKGQLAQAVAQNEKLSYTLREAREHIATLRDEVDKLTQPPSAYGVVVGKNDDGTVDILTSGRKMKVATHPDIDLDTLDRGSEVVLNESFNVVLARQPGADRRGRLDQGGAWRTACGRSSSAGPTRSGSASWPTPLRGIHLRAGDTMRLDTALEPAAREAAPARGRGPAAGGGARHLLQRHRRPRRPDRADRRRRRAAVPAPRPVRRAPPAGAQGHPALRPARAAARRSSPRPWPTAWPRRSPSATGDEKGRSYFINIKGPELLNKYVGETERQIRLVFQRAREKSEEGWPVIVFFDEMDSMFRTRGSGISSDMESTIVPQLLAEIDGVEGLRNVIVIGATNREDLIDPAILRPGRLDVKIKIERPNARGRRADLRPVPDRRDPHRRRRSSCRR